MKSVLIFKPWMRKGDVYFRYKQYALAMQNMGIECVYIGAERTDKKKAGLLGNLQALYEAFQKRKEYDAVIIPSRKHLFFFTNYFSFVLRKNTIIDHLSSDVAPKYLFSFFDTFAYKQADHVITFTESYKDLITDAFNLKKDKVIVLYCAVDEAIFQPRPDTESEVLKKELGIEDKFVVLYHGMHHPWHGLTYLLEAAEILKDHEDIQFVILPQGFLEDNENLVFVPEQKFEDLPKFIQLADIWASGFDESEKSEIIMNSTVIQAIIMGRPILTAHGKEKEKFLIDNQNAFFVQNKSEEAIAQKILEIKDNKTLLKEAAEKNAALGKEQFSVQTIIDTLESVLDRSN